MKSKYSVVVFDLGNVLIPFDYRMFLDKLDLLESGLGKIFADRYRENYDIHKKYERWQISTNQFVKIMLKWINNKLNGEEFCRIFSDIFTVNESVVSLLPELKQNYTLVLLSNTNFIHQKYGWAKYEFISNFDKLILSHEVGAVKPEEKIYKAVEKFTKAPAGEHIFIDDIEEYVDAAKMLGWDGIQFTGFDNLVSELKQRNIM